MAKAIVHFDIQAADVERAIKFYETVFDWKIQKWGDQEYWLVYTGRGKYPDGQKVGIDGGLRKRTGAKPFVAAPANAFVCTLEVEDINATIKAVEKAGGKVIVAKSKLGEFGWTCYCQDTEANNFGLIQPIKQ